MEGNNSQEGSMHHNHFNRKLFEEVLNTLKRAFRIYFDVQVAVRNPENELELKRAVQSLFKVHESMHTIFIEFNSHKTFELIQNLKSLQGQGITEDEMIQLNQLSVLDTPCSQKTFNNVFVLPLLIFTCCHKMLDVSQIMSLINSPANNQQLQILRLTDPDTHNKCEDNAQKALKPMMRMTTTDVIKNENQQRRRVTDQNLLFILVTSISSCRNYEMMCLNLDGQLPHQFRKTLLLAQYGLIKEMQFLDDESRCKQPIMIDLTCESGWNFIEELCKLEFEDVDILSESLLPWYTKDDATKKLLMNFYELAMQNQKYKKEFGEKVYYCNEQILDLLCKEIDEDEGGND